MVEFDWLWIDAKSILLITYKSLFNYTWLIILANNYIETP